MAGFIWSDAIKFGSETPLSPPLKLRRKDLKEKATQVEKILWGRCKREL